MVSIVGGLNPGPLGLESSALTTRPQLLANLVGFIIFSEPPAVATYWQKCHKKNWEVKTFEKSRCSGQEKQVDTAIIADVFEQVAHSYKFRDVQKN
jgi:hypothetical protein